MVLKVIGTKRWELSRVVSFTFVSCVLILLAANCLGTGAQERASGGRDPLRWYGMSAPSSPIPGNPTNQHCFDVVHTTNIVRCNVVIDGSSRAYLAYDSDNEGNNTYLFYSDNLTGPWTPYSKNPILTSTSGSVRTPCVVYTGGVFEMFLNNLTNKDIERWNSTDGTTFTYAETVLTSPDDMWTNPFVWFNPNDSKWCLFWEDGNNTGETWTIKARNSSSVTGLASEGDTLVLSSASTMLRHMACPTIIYRDGHYWLLCETLPVEEGIWEVCAFVSTSVTSGYAQCPNSPVLTGDEACPRVYVADDGVSCYLFTNQQFEIWYQEERTVYAGNYLHLTLSVDPDLATYTGGQSVSLVVTVLNEFDSPLGSTLTLAVTGPAGYGYFDLDRMNATVGFSEYSFDWTVPSAKGTYVVEVSTVPVCLTAYDAAWLEAV